MRMATLSPLLLGVIILALASGTARAVQLYRCPDTDGVRYTNTPDSDLCLPAMRLAEETENASDRSDFLKMTEKYARLYCVDPHMARAVLETESNMNPKAVSEDNAQGLMQIMPQTQRDLRIFDAFNPEESIEGGVRYLAMLLERYGRTELALAAYNAGPAAVDRYGGIPPFEETRMYVIRVLSRMLELNGLTAQGCSSAK